MLALIPLMASEHDEASAQSSCGQRRPFHLQPRCLNAFRFLLHVWTVTTSTGPWTVRQHTAFHQSVTWVAGSCCKPPILSKTSSKVRHACPYKLAATVHDHSQSYLKAPDLLGPRWPFRLSKSTRCTLVTSPATISRRPNGYSTIFLIAICVLLGEFTTCSALNSVGKPGACI